MIRKLKFVALAVLLCIIVGALWHCRFLVGMLLSYAENYVGKMVCILLALYVLKGCSGVILYSVLAFTTALVLPFPMALSVNALGTVLCITVSYGYGRLTDSGRLDAVLKRSPKLSKLIRGNETNCLLLCFGTRMAGISAELSGVVFGLMRIPYVPYVLVSLMGIAPGMLCLTIAGFLRDIHSPWFWILQGTNLLFAPLGVFVLTRNRGMATNPVKDNVVDPLITD